MQLPVLDLEPQLVEALRSTRRVILSAPPGSGKSTQVPQILDRHGFLKSGQAVLLQPRRIAARLLAARVAHEMGVELGQEVGYQVRFENVTSPSTKIRFVTEGLLFRQMTSDPDLRGVAALVFDEFHERHLEGDMALARALEIQARRPELLVVVMSATLDAGRLEKFLAPCATLSSDGALHPVAVDYDAGTAPVWDRAADAVARWARADGDGHALVFMPGAYEISRTLEALHERPETRARRCLPLHGELAPTDQDAAVSPSQEPRVIVATNVAETSLTIEGVRLVVDSGLARVPRFDPWRGINTLFVEPISRASADQRAGRAGRTGPGKCLRLWSAAEKRAEREEPEVKRVDLAEALLDLAVAGVPDARAFRWLDAPEEKAVARAEELLADLGAVRDGAVTPLGKRMAAFPLQPRWSRMLLAAHDLRCVRQAALAAALTQGRDLLVRRADALAEERRDDLFGDRDTSDFYRLMRAWEWAAQNGFRLEACRRAGVHAQAARMVAPAFDLFVRIAAREGLDVSDAEASEESLRKCLLIGFSDRVARRADMSTLRCEIVHGRKGSLAKESAVRKARLLVAAEIRELEGRERGQVVLSLATAVDEAWLAEMFPGDITRRVEAKFDPESKRVLGEERTRFRDLMVSSRLVDPPADEAARLLAAEIAAGRLVPDEWDASVEQWILRVNFIAKACPDLGVSPIGAEDRQTILEEICAGATSWKDVKGRPVKSAVKGWLDGAKQALVEKHAPDRLELANGRKPKVVYDAEHPPHVAMRIQELYDVPRIPAIAMARVVPLLHILAPSNRPVQVTADLAGFWREHYPRVKKELQRKYPRHEWR